LPIACVAQDDLEGRVVSSWGPYTSIVGTAVKTGVAGLTAKAELKAKTGWGDLAPEDRRGAMTDMGQELLEAFSKIDKVRRRASHAKRVSGARAAALACCCCCVGSWLRWLRWWEKVQLTAACLRGSS
jgi:hypothetical protein